MNADSRNELAINFHGCSITEARQSKDNGDSMPTKTTGTWMSLSLYSDQ